MRALVIATLILLGAAEAGAQNATWKLGRAGRPYADVPFEIVLQIDGFDETPAPDQPKLEIAGAQVTPLGVSPSSSRSIQIINGRRIDDVRVTWAMRWRVTANAGTLRLPATTVKQGSKSATSQPAEAPIDTVPQTKDMRIELALPDRPVFVGESVPVKLYWYFRVSPEEQSFTVPLVGLDALAVSGVPVPQGTRRTVSLTGGSKDLDLPFELDDATVDGTQFKRLTVTLFVAPRSVPPGGKLEVPPSAVVAGLQVGRPDFFGRAESRMFRAVDTARTLTVKPLPETDRPPTFAGAVGEQFSIDVRTSRSVVSLGEPVELEVTIKSDQRLDALSLGKLDGDGRLPKDKFTAPAESPTGELSADGKSKTFKVVAQVTGPATEIPALSFAYFDPKSAKYQTIASRPIALSVKGGSVVGADDVVVGAKKPKTQTTVEETSLVNADLALSSTGTGTPLGGPLLWILVGLLYAVPLGIFGFRRWQLRTESSREEASEVRVVRKQVEDLLDKAANTPAREVAGPLVAAMRELARVLARTVDDHGLLARIETESFAPEAAGKPLSPDLRSDAAGLLRRWSSERRSGKPASAAAIALVIVAIAGGEARADAFDDGRQAYQYAMELTGDASGRKAAFARAATALGEAARAHPDRPELLADWGNAALGAGDAGTAVLAYRRALALDPSNTRARHNLAWLRGRLPTHLQSTASAGATDTLLFFHRWPRAQRLLVGAAAFAIAILLVVPWTRRRRRTGAYLLASLALVMWAAMLASVILEDRHGDDAVVLDGVVLRAADSAGAPAAFTEPLPRGLEVTILERRDTWTRVALSTGASGWVPDGAVERVIR